MFNIGKPTGGGGSADLSRTLLKTDNLASVSDKEQALDNLGASAKADIDGVVSFAALRTREPRYEGERIWLAGWNEGKKPYYGGGRFVGHIGTAADDGGMIAAGTGFYWRRELKDACELNITHFGAIPDGTTDCKDAVLAMQKYTYANLGANRDSFVNIPAGSFALSSVDFSGGYLNLFSLRGPSVKFGFSPVAKIKQIGAAGSYAISLQAANVEISSLAFDGGYTTANPVWRGIATNNRQTGQRWRGAQLRVTNLGGVGFNMLDTLDTVFDDIFSDGTYDSLFRGRPSYNTQGVWDHITAISLTNGNMQNVKGTNPGIDLPAATQSFMFNWWLEKTIYPANLEGGQWLLDGVSVEGMDDTFPGFNVTGGAITMRGTNLQNATINRKNANPAKYLDSYNQGFRRDEAYGSTIAGTMAVEWFSSNLRMNNTSTTAMAWYRVASYQIQAANDSLTVRFFGARGEVSATGNLTPKSNNFGGGDAVLRLRHASASATDNSIKCVGAVEVHGTSPINDIYIERTYARNAVIYVQLPVNSGWVGVQAETTADNRFQSGAPFLWTPDGTVVSDADMATKIAAGLYRPLGNAALSNVAGKGIIINDDGGITLATKDIINNKLRVIVNGTAFRIPLELDAILSDKFNRAGEISGTNADNQLGGSGTYGWSSNSTGYRTETGSLNVTSKIAGATSLRINASNVKPSFIVVSGPTATATAINAAFEFRKFDGSTTADCYRLAMRAKDANGKTAISLVKRVGGVETTISPADGTVTDGQQITVAANGSSIKVYVAGVILWDLTDTSIPAGEVIGFAAGTGNTGYRVSTLIIDNV